MTFANVEANVDENLLSTIVDCLKHDDISVSCNAAKCLQRFQIPKVMSSLPVLSKFQSIMSMNASMRSRVYDVSYSFCAVLTFSVWPQEILIKVNAFFDGPFYII